MNRLAALAAISLLLSACTTNQHTASPPTCFHQSAAMEIDIGYCQAVRVGNTLHISGTVAEGDMPAAIRSAYQQLNETLKANGLTFANVVRETVYTTNLDAFIQHKDIRKEFFGQTFPAASWLQVQRLYTPALVVEVELTAEFPK